MPDPLTGLLTAPELHTALRSASSTAKEKGEFISLLYVIVEDLQLVRARVSFAGSERVLRDIAELIGQVVQAPGVLARYRGGEEFVALMPNTSLSAAISAAEAVRALVEGNVAERIRAVVDRILQPQADHSDYAAYVRSAIGVEVRLSVGVATSSKGRDWDARAVLELGQLYARVANSEGGNRVLHQPEGEWEKSATWSDELPSARLPHADSLQGLPSYEQLNLALSILSAQTGETGQPVSLLRVVLDGFHDVGGWFEGEARRNLLLRIAERLREEIRQTGMLEYSGNEFTVLLPDTDSAAAAVAAERVRRFVANASLFGDLRIGLERDVLRYQRQLERYVQGRLSEDRAIEMRLRELLVSAITEADDELRSLRAGLDASVSIGIATSPKDSGWTPEALFTLAYDRRRRAEAAGGNRVVGEGAD